MRVIARGRQSGRTLELVRLAAEAESRGEVCYIICASRDEAQRIVQVARAEELVIGFPITYDEFLDGAYSHRTIHHLYLDNAETLLQRLSRVPLEVVTILSEPC